MSGRQRILSLVLALVICLSMLPGAVFGAEDVVDTGTCGPSLEWSLSADGVLTISGQGDMRDFESSGEIPWYYYRERILSAVISTGVTTIGKNAFYSCEALSSVSIPDSVTSIGSFAFDNCRSLVFVTIPSSVTSIGDFAFAFTDLLGDVYYTGTEDQWSAITIGDYNDSLTTARLQCSALLPPVPRAIAGAANGVAFSWNPVYGAGSYRVFRKTATTRWAHAGETTEHYYVDTTAESGVTYTYTVRCLSEDGTSYISAFDTVGLSIDYIAAPALTGASVGADGVTITWTPSAGAENYRAFRLAEDGSWTHLGDTSGASFLDTDVTPGSTYTYTVRCLSEDGSSYISPFDTEGIKVTYVAAPVLESVICGRQGVVLAWNASAGATNYRVYRKTDTVNWERLGDTTDLSYVDTTAVSGMTYSYTVRCLNDDSLGFASFYDTDGLTITYIAAPVLVSAIRGSGGVTITWNASAGAAKYRVFRLADDGSWTHLGETEGTTFLDADAPDNTCTYTVRCLSEDSSSYVSAFDANGITVGETKQSEPATTPIPADTTPVPTPTPAATIAPAFTAPPANSASPGGFNALQNSTGKAETSFHVLAADPCDPESAEDAAAVPVFSSGYTRGEISSVRFLNTLTGAPADAWDVSEDRDGSILAWTTPNGALYDLTIAADGDISAPADCSWMFCGYQNAKRIDFGSGFHTDDATSMFMMFSYCSSLTDLDVSSFDTSNVTDMMFMFNECSGLTSLDVSLFQTSNTIDMGGMFADCSGLTSLDVRSFDTSNVKYMDYMFFDCSGLTELDLSGFNTANALRMESMFSGCTGLTSLDISGFNTANVTRMDAMFFDCSGLTSLDVSGFNTANVTDMSRMFLNCSGLTSLDVSGFQTASVTDMRGMFYECIGLTRLDVSGFQTSNVTDMSYMFRGCSGLTSLDVSGFDTTNVSTMNSMFTFCEGLLGLDVSGFNTANVTDMDSMFTLCSRLYELDLSGFDFSQAEIVSYMFYGCIDLEYLDLGSFGISAGAETSEIFTGAENLKEIAFQGTADTWNAFPFAGSEFLEGVTITCY